MDYTYEEVLEACQDVKLKIKEKKNREHMDMRNYLIALRYYKFFETEEYISKDFGIDRCSVNYAKGQPSMLLSIKDISFSANVAILAVQFPYDFPKIRDPKFKRSSSVIVYLDQSTTKKLDMFMMVKDIKRRDIAARELIIRALKLWEE